MTVESIANFFKVTESGQMVREEGREEGHEEAVEVLLQQRFGNQDGLAALAARLLSSFTLQEAIQAVVRAGSFEDLVRDSAPPVQ